MFEAAVVEKSDARRIEEYDVQLILLGLGLKRRWWRLWNVSFPCGYVWNMLRWKVTFDAELSLPILKGHCSAIHRLDKRIDSRSIHFCHNVLAETSQFLSDVFDRS